MIIYFYQNKFRHIYFSKTMHIFMTYYLLEATLSGYIHEFQNYQQPPEVFYKKRCSQKYRKIHGKTPVPETLAQAPSCEICDISKNTFSYGISTVAASVIYSL